MKDVTEWAIIGLVLILGLLYRIDRALQKVKNQQTTAFNSSAAFMQ
jgi:hypothetical protein